ncbi:hypothetical protein [Persicobacter diffluens]|uniref:Uncharacterized protein n=1 Tax=Persicobacter diffluens TaxID=981 RepID=A0AAN5AQ90_9BACT|nr:hypothetical protein PEDI_51700 [Persicobacter diffluens]
MSWSDFFLLVTGILGIYYGVVAFFEYINLRRQNINSTAFNITYDMGALVQEDAAPPEEVKMEDFKPGQTAAKEEEVTFGKIYDEGMDLDQYYARAEEFMETLSENVFATS